MQTVLHKKMAQIKDKLEFLQQVYSVKTIAFFGSIVRNDFNQESDIDIMVEFSEPISFFKFIELERHLSSVLGVKVDLVTKNGIKPTVKSSILNEAVYV